MLQGIIKTPNWIQTVAFRWRRRLRTLFPSQKITVEEARRLKKQMHDFASGGLALFWQRQGIYAGAAILCGFYYSIPIAVLCYFLCQVTDLFDSFISLRVINRKDHSFRHSIALLKWLFFSNTLSTFAVATFTYLIAKLEGPTEHFASLFFLFAAGLFAAVNNHQLPQVLAVRLVIYGMLFIYIPGADIWTEHTSYQSTAWLHFATSLFVLYFVLECSVIFLRLYQKGLDQLDELRAERDRAQESYEVKSQFVSVVSHELRTPLTSINGSLTLLRDTDLSKNPDSAARMLDIAHKNSQRLSKLINDLLDIQKMEAHKMTYIFASIDLGELIEEAAQSVTPYADQFETVIRVSRPKHPITIRADHERMMQVLDNLLSNAVKFSYAGSYIELTAGLYGDRPMLEVRDYGIGIPEDAHEKVFEKFQQVDNSDRRDFDGTGLGLSIVRQIVDDHDADIDFESTPGEGTRFYIVFPPAPDVSDD
ncbi:phospho-acceptor domain-containing protein [Shimia isoporae]|uniref:histidine kinase n=1 Tax=Shimia isoporae TaxID=647720 RepID=A0A4R1NPP2_9RHOB|nr:HAMP domain-containing sensor histidine kinase [Shimia isoporae]TCL10205.1 phospho-acceptor domain-containing protein [Shimia isoporae]